MGCLINLVIIFFVLLLMSPMIVHAPGIFVTVGIITVVLSIIGAIKLTNDEDKK